MDDEHSDNGGFGGLAWYQIGRWSMELDQERQRTYDHVSGRGPVSRADYNRAVRLNQALAAEDRRLNNLVDILQAQVNNARADYERLRVWANERQAEVDALKAKCEAIEANSREKSDLISDLYQRWKTLLNPYNEPPPLDS